MNLQPDDNKECLICYETKKDLGILESCQHVFCAPCLRTWRAGGRIRWDSSNFDWNSRSATDNIESYLAALATGVTCPYCRVRSDVALYTDLTPASADDKWRMFTDYRKSAADVLLSDMLGEIGSEWALLVRAFLSTCSSECVGVEGYELDSYADRNDLTLSWNGRHHASFWAGTSQRSIFCLRVEGISVQLLLTTEDFDDDDFVEECDDEADIPEGGFVCKMADGAVTWLLEMVEKSSWREVLPALNPRHEDFLMISKFDKITCALYARRTGVPDAARNGPWNEMRRDPLWNLPKHNFVLSSDVDEHGNINYDDIRANHNNNMYVWRWLQTMKTKFFAGIRN